MKKINTILILLLGLFTSCLKENLDPVNLKKVVLLQIDYQSYTFEGGKEFSYFKNDTSTVDLPASASFLPPSPNGRLTIFYTSDTLFDGTQIWQGTGKRNYPENIDNQIHYFRIENSLTKPADSKFQTIFYDLGAAPIQYDSIWGAIDKLDIVNRYQMRNSTAKIGIFLFRPSDGVLNPGDWKWYVILKN